MISVLVVDDEDLLRSGFAALVDTSADAYVVGEARNGKEAVAMAEQLTPDVVLMDIRMPALDGVEATAEILSQSGVDKPAILMLTVLDVDQYVYAALRAGAAGFLLKDTSVDMLHNGIRVVAKGERLFAETVTRRLVEAYTRRGIHSTGFAGRLDVLTERELEVVRLAGMGMTNGDIAAKLFIGAATVKTHLNRAMAKLHISSRAQIVVFAYESGLVVPGQMELNALVRDDG
ncbi:response regulator transcription factor [Kibdelosporangium philippinense]|uniref:Response regulator transcription factor n=1 Tax=Kibdelosporangium philippinense TaxID=211113 RepID=A0ABS8ZQT2_9PSEU|nr:response regulator transcription factor [Kibdelosporangium philippinense]MCE7010118.1 response regulator transcription factor [Kibdelosporangium philippinense]